MKAMSITECGNVVVWKSYEGQFVHQKELLKSVKICQNPLKVIKSVDSFVIIADALGHIRFYDEELRIVFWCPSYDSIDSITTLSFNLQPKPIKTSEENEQNNEEINNKIAVRDFFIRKSSENFHTHKHSFKFPFFITFYILFFPFFYNQKQRVKFILSTCRI